MGLSLSFNISSPLAALAMSGFKGFNFQFPSGHTGPSVTFTPLKILGAEYKKNEPPAEAQVAFALGNIRFYLPQQMSINYNANYQETEMSNILRAFTDGENKSWGDRISEGAQRLMQAGIENGVGAVGDFTGVSGAKAALRQATNTAYNNHMEVMFQGMGFRQFQFDFKFFPQNPGEAAGIRSAINQFKYHMHPNFKAGTAESVFDVPSRFSINVSGGKGMYGAFQEAVLVDMTVNFHGSGVAAQFHDGMPAEIDLSLTFKETTYLTKEKLYPNPIFAP